ncbi:UDP-4-amino-4,6-dideoxy-N-acetyl-beta-L-altrosamine transaminase [Gottfriedia acidiceleris]|uniref:UDP-4-amino-4, 6-dideoxy-N-acetyl-beta-L-altrosamine transaminase n=1 Tax=Gottfriedia acidiceleris TaxID=371036 RepID=UPI00101DC1EA|nr:UDP-4-amino-4,6-dideoxy-N-acetyl-beta-L-altrosamine transaminase [Gottfriedia acidiceleris]
MNKDKLAIHGGQPVRENFLPYGKQVINEDDIRSVIDILGSDFLTTGPTIEQFERDIAEYTGAKYAVAFSSGTAALHGACFVAGIGEGDEVITSPMTFAASSNCVLYQGGIPVFVDIDPNTYNMSPSLIKEKITKNTKAIIPVHFTGQPVDLENIIKIAKENNLIIIEDAAHALGAKYKNKKIGSIGDMTMFSFHPVKHITTGEGGIITTNNKDYYQKLLQFRTHGISRSKEFLNEYHGPWYYEMHSLGYNYRLTDIQASLGISQLKKIDSYIDRRKQIANFYTKELKALDEIILPYQAIDGDSSWHLYIIKLQSAKLTANRKEIYEALQKENIGVNVHYIPVYYHPYYQSLGYKKGLCTIAEKCYEEFITLPLHAGMSVQDSEDVVNAIKKVLSFYSKTSQ